jgi:4-hydroxybenzoate polyprenyltransferase
MSNIVKSGGEGVIGGAIAGFAFAGPIGALAGGILGLAGGLVKGAAMEAFGVNDAIDNTMDMVVSYTKEQVQATGTLSIEYKVKE